MTMVEIVPVVESPIGKKKKKKPKMLPAKFLDSEKAPGLGLSSYSFPEKGHVFDGGRSAVTKWVKMMTMTAVIKPTKKIASKKRKHTNSASNDEMAPDGTPEVTPEGIHGETPTTEGTPGETPTPEGTPGETPTAVTASGDESTIQQPSGDYPKYGCYCVGCPGYIRVKFEPGRNNPGEVTECVQCKCDRRTPRLKDTIYASKEEIIGDLILHINNTYGTFVVNFKQIKSNSTSMPTAFLTNDNQLFVGFIKDKKKINTTEHKFVCGEVKEHTIHHPVPVAAIPVAAVPVAAVPVVAAPAPPPEEPRTCPGCMQSEHEKNDFLLFNCGHVYCNGCFQRQCDMRRDSQALYPACKNGERPAFFWIGQFYHVNMKGFSCPICNGRVKEYSQLSSPDVPHTVALPYGWIGDRPEYSKPDYEETEAICKRVIGPYLDIYKKAVHLLTPQSQKGITNEAVREMLKEAAQSMLDYCHNKIYYDHEWLQNKEVPIPDELTIDPYVADFFSDYPVQGHRETIETCYQDFRIRGWVN